MQAKWQMYSETKNMNFKEILKYQSSPAGRDEVLKGKAHIAEMDRDGVVYCPKCKGTNLSANKKGFGIGKAVVGGVIGIAAPLGALGLLGLTAGNMGAKKIRITCLKCGHEFWAGGK